MTSPSPEQAQGQIELLLVEYRALRDDINNRIGSQSTLLGFAAAGLAVVIGTKHASAWIYVLIGGPLACLAAGVWITNNLWIRAIGNHLKTIEHDVNTLAAIAWGPLLPERLLRWQSGTGVPMSRYRQLLNLLGLSARQ